MNDMRPREHQLDTTTLLANRAVGWEGDAERATADADRLEGQARELDRGQTGMGDLLRRQAQAHREAAGRHRERAAAAKQGRLLVHDDLDWQLKNHELHSRCVAEGRATYPPGTTRIP
jgi:hypothetical protein